MTPQLEGRRKREAASTGSGRRANLTFSRQPARVTVRRESNPTARLGSAVRVYPKGTSP